MLTLFLLNLLTASAEAPEPPKDMTYRLDANLSYFTTSANYPPGGFATDDLANSGSFADLMARFSYTQDLDRARRVYGGLTYSSTESYDGAVTRSNSNFNELHAGGQYWLKYGLLRSAPSLDFTYPLQRIDRGTDDALLGEGAIRLKLGSWFFWPLAGELKCFAFLGYEYRDEGRSHAIPYALGLKWNAPSLWAQLEYSGYERLFANADTENRDSRDVFLRRVNGGSYRYYAINSALSEFVARAGVRFGAVTVSAGAGITVNGSSAAQGLTFMGGIAYAPGSGGSKSDRGDFDSFDRFESVPDENFDRLDPTRPPPAMQPKSVKKPKAKPVRPKKNKVDQLLDEAEKGLKNL